MKSNVYKWERVLDRLNIGTSLDDALVYRKNKERAYREGFEEFIETAIPCRIKGKNYFVHPNVNFYLDLSSACNCKCEFCIAETTYQRKGVDTRYYLDKLEEEIINLKHINPSVQIVGGEPTIDNKIYSVIKMVDKHNLTRPVLGTNGYGLTNELIDCINESSIEHVNLSRHHYNENTNQEIMRSTKLFGNNDITQRVAKINKDIRVQCNMIGTYIDTYGEVMQYISYAYHKLGITNIAFAQLTPLPENDIYQQSIIDYVKERQVDIDAILERVSSDSRFVFKKYRGGVACYYEVWEFTAYEKPVTVLFKFSDNKWLVKADKINNYVPDIIFHTDGTLAGSWNKNIKHM